MALCPAEGKETRERVGWRDGGRKVDSRYRQMKEKRQMGKKEGSEITKRKARMGSRQRIPCHGRGSD